MTKGEVEKILYIGKDGWPVEGFIGKPIKTFFRRLFLTRKMMRYKTWLKNGGCKINFNLRKQFFEIADGLFVDN